MAHVMPRSAGVPWFCVFPFLVLLSVSACGGESSSGLATPSPPSPSSSGGGVGDYSAFGPAEPVTITNYNGDAMEPFVSKDRAYLFFNNRNDPATNTDLFYAVRIDDLTYQFQGPIGGANSTALDAVASMDSSGQFYFISVRDYDSSLSTIYTGQFSGGTISAPVIATGLSRLQRGELNFDAEISADGQTMWFNDGTFTGGAIPEVATLVVAERQPNGFVRRSDSAALLQAVNAAGLNYAPSISADGLELFFTRVNSPTATTTPVIMRTMRASTAAPFGTPQRVGAATGHVEAPTLSGDGRALYFHRLENGRFRIYRTQR